MNRDALRAILASHEADLRALGVRALSVFGSVARGTENETSDVDLLVDFDPPPTFDRFMDLKLMLEGWLATRVDLVTRRALKPRLRARIEAEALRVA